MAKRLDRARLLVLKGGGGEAERAPGKSVSIYLHQRSAPDSERVLPALMETPAREASMDTRERLVSVWHGTDRSEVPTKTAIGTIAMALLALQPARDVADTDRHAEEIWQRRHD